MKTNKALLSVSIILLITSVVISATPKDLASNEAVVYYNKACGACMTYITETLEPTLKKTGIEITKRDYINDPGARKEMNSLNDAWNVPPELQSHLATFVGEKLTLQGHIPPRILDTLLAQGTLEDINRLLIYQDKMDNPTFYKAWGFRGEPKKYSIDTPISEYLNWFRSNKDTLPPAGMTSSSSPKKLLPVILTTGLLDGINPCAIAVLLFFVAFLFSMNRARVELAKVGLIYIGVIYLTYLGIGLGILRAFVFTGAEHLMAKLGAGLLLLLGLINVKDYFWYGRWFSLSPGSSFHQKGKDWLKKATYPSTVVGAFFVGLCTFPCSGGIYVAILGLLSSRTTYWSGLGYMLLYNFAFVVPLIVILFATANKRTAGRLSRWQATNKRQIKLATGLLMIGLSVGILIWLF
ncbi:MAG: cytochrome c biogenesis protein CcdA [Candidatus Bipolaricaulia bacterium]